MPKSPLNPRRKCREKREERELLSLRFDISAPSLGPEKRLIQPMGGGNLPDLSSRGSQFISFMTKNGAQCTRKEGRRGGFRSFDFRNASVSKGATPLVRKVPLAHRIWDHGGRRIESPSFSSIGVRGGEPGWTKRPSNLIQGGVVGAQEKGELIERGNGRERSLHAVPRR